MITFIKTPIGNLRVTYKNETLVEVKSVEGDHNENKKLQNEAEKQIIEYFDGKRTVFDLKYELSGTDFQKKIWKEMIKIPFGSTMSYKELAEKIGKPKAYRAVANAAGKNPLLIICPCHRVVGSKSIGGFSCGIEKKIILMKLEGIIY